MRAFSYPWSRPVTWQRWRSHHSIRRSRKPHDSRKPHVSMFYRSRVIRDQSLQCVNGDFRLFCSCDLDLDPMTFMYELDPYSLELHRICVKLSSDRQTYIQTEWTTIIYHAALPVVGNSFIIETAVTAFSPLSGQFLQNVSIFCATFYSPMLTFMLQQRLQEWLIFCRCISYHTATFVFTECDCLVC